MGIRALCFGLFFLGIAILFHRERLIHEKTVHLPSPAPTLSSNPQDRPYYQLGNYQKVQTPRLNVLDLLTQILTYQSRKKINNYVFNHYLQYRVELVLVDIGYSSILEFHFWNQDSGSFQFQQKIGFTLPQPFNGQPININVNKKKFKFSMKQHYHNQKDLTITTFNLTSSRRYSNVTLNLTHAMRNEQCFTAIRTGDVISHKCYGGYGEGKVVIERYITKQTKRNNILNPTFNLTRTSFDGLRVSSIQMKWTWITASGFSKPEFYANGQKIDKERWLGLNFGSINNESEDFIFFNGKIFPVKSIKYQINEEDKINDVMHFTSQFPKMEANFTILAKSNRYKDLGIIKLDMVRMEGYWAGWVEDEDGTKIQFYLIAGMVETSDSWF